MCQSTFRYGSSLTDLTTVKVKCARSDKHEGTPDSPHRARVNRRLIEWWEAKGLRESGWRWPEFMKRKGWGNGR